MSEERGEDTMLDLPIASATMPQAANGAQAADGDDYTWNATPSGAAVLKTDGGVSETVRRAGQMMGTIPIPDLRTADQVEQDDVAALTLHEQLRVRGMAGEIEHNG